MIKTKRVYDRAEPSDGKRILVMRTWPRGVAKGRVDAWMKDLGTPKALVSSWKRGDVGWEEFRREYLASLRGKERVLESLAREAEEGTITLLCGCGEASRCHRSLLKSAIENSARS